jgi:hypothetical protein
LSDDIVLIDSPGVIPEDQYSEIDKEKIAHHTLAGGKSWTQVKEPEMVVHGLMKKYSEVLNNFYGCNCKDSEELIEFVGREKGFLKKGGEVNEDQAARSILKDWQEGKIKV